MQSRTVEQIKEKLNIVDVVGQYVDLKKAGGSYRGLSPFTSEKTPSFFVSPEKGLYHCFSSGKGGDIFTFVQEIEGVDFKGALKILAERAGVELKPENPKERNRRDRLFEILEKATQLFQQQLSKNVQASEYLSKRGLTQKTIKDWRIGFAPDEWRRLKEDLARYNEADLLATGLIKKGDTQNSYDVFRNRIIFPIADTSGRIIAFTGRILDPEDEPKYLNTPDTELFEKSDVLFGLDKARQAIHKFGYSVLVEGQMDVIMCHQAGFKNVVATSGTSLTDKHLRRLSQVSKRSIFCFDSDGAGLRATMKGVALASESGIDVKIATLPQGEDPADVVLKDPSTFKKALQNSKHVVDFYLDWLEENIEDSRKRVKDMQETLLPVVAHMRSDVEKDMHIKTISDRLSISAKALWSDVSRIKDRKDEQEEIPVERSSFSDKGSLIRHIVAIVMWQEDKDDPTIDIEEITKRLKTLCGEDVLERSKKEMKEILPQIVFKAEERFSEGVPSEYIEELLLRIEEMSIAESITEIRKKIEDLEKKGDVKEISKHLKELQELANKKATIVNNRLKLFIK